MVKFSGYVSLRPLIAAWISFSVITPRFRSGCDPRMRVRGHAFDSELAREVDDEPVYGDLLGGSAGARTG